jgi:uncharacterized protein
MHQHVKEVLFLHWRWDAGEIRKTLPPGLKVDTFQGHAWLGILPSFAGGMRLHFGPAIPGLSAFFQLSVQTYVFDVQGRPGIWVYSMDASRWLAVRLGRAWFGLPCEHADMTAEREPAGRVDYRVRRQGADLESRFVYDAVPGSPAGSGASEAEPGSLEFFLVERYRVFTCGGRRGLFTRRMAHEPHLVGRAEVCLWDDAMLRLAGFDPEGSAPDHICLSRALDIEIFPPERVAAPEPAPAPAPGAGHAGAVAV